MYLHTWKDPEMYQIWALKQANQNDWWKETQKNCPIKVIDLKDPKAQLWVHPLSESTHVYSHILYYFPNCVHMYCHFTRVWLFVSPMDCSLPVSSVYGDSPHKNTGVGSHSLLQGLFPTQALNPHLQQLLHCRQILYHWATREAPFFLLTNTCFSTSHLRGNPFLQSWKARALSLTTGLLAKI